MIEFGVSPPPREVLNQNQSIWYPWDVWFKRLRNAVPLVQTYSATLTPASVAATSTSEQTFSVPGLVLQDIIAAVNKPTHTSGIGIVGARVSAGDTLAITFLNVTGGAIVPPAETYKIVSVRL